MTITDLPFYLIEMFGLVAFSVSGTMTGLKYKLDLFGVMFIAVVTALGGGAIRDVIIGYVPPMMFRSYQYVLVSCVTALTLFLADWRLKGRFYAKELKIETVANVFDALGLGSFVAAGVQAGINAGYGGNGFFLVFLGMLTGVGGGVLRDLFVQRMPMVLVKHIYAVAALIGGCLYLILYRLGLDELPATAVEIAVVFLIRMLATKYRWNLPHAE